MQRDMLLEVNTYLWYIEDIFNKKGIGSELEPYLLFINGERYPIKNRYKYNQNMGVSSYPYFPYKSAPLFSRLLKYDLYTTSDIIMVHYNVNIGRKICRNIFEDYDLTPADIVLEYLPSVNPNELELIFATVRNFVLNNEKYLWTLRDHVVDIDLDKEYLRIIDHGDILAYRYKELMDAKR